MPSSTRWTYLYCIDVRNVESVPTRRYNLIVLAIFVISIALAAPAQGQPVPQPFPRPGAPAGQTPPARPAQPASPASPAAPPTATPSPADGAPSEATLGVPIYPGAQFLTSYDAGRDQRYYLFGSAASFVD